MLVVLTIAWRSLSAVDCQFPCMVLEIIIVQRVAKKINSNWRQQVNTCATSKRADKTCKSHQRYVAMRHGNLWLNQVLWWRFLFTVTLSLNCMLVVVRFKRARSEQNQCQTSSTIELPCKKLEIFRSVFLEKGKSALITWLTSNSIKIWIFASRQDKQCHKTVSKCCAARSMLCCSQNLGRL